MAARWARRIGAAGPAALVTACIPQVAPPPYRPPPPTADRPRSAPLDLPAQASPPAQPRQRPRPAPLELPGPRPDTRVAGGGPVSALPAPRPAWEARPVAADARTVPDGTYTVEAGDTLAGVAQKTGAAIDAIAQANGLKPPFTILVGQRLAIPGGRYHLVRSGQTGIAIAQAYGVDWSRIVTANALEEPYILRAGQRILIPGDAAHPVSAAERAAAFSLDIDDLVTGSQPALAADEAPAKPTASPKRVLPATVAVAAPKNLRTGFIWPVDGKVVGRFGPGANAGVRNDGMEIAVPVDTPVKAAADGVVAYVGDGIAALGGLVIVRHGDGWTSVYGHASKLLVQRGQSVKRGQTIALSGDTGFADRPELHFELRKGRDPVDPLTKLPKR